MGHPAGRALDDSPDMLDERVLSRPPAGLVRVPRGPRELPQECRAGTVWTCVYPNICPDKTRGSATLGLLTTEQRRCLVGPMC